MLFYKKLQFLIYAIHCGAMLHPSSWEVELGEPAVQGQPQLYNLFKANLSYLRLCLKPLPTKEIANLQDLVAHAFNPSTQEVRAVGSM